MSGHSNLPPEQMTARHMSGHAETLDIANSASGIKGCDAVFPYDSTAAYGGMRDWALLLLAENQRLADRAVCSGCGSDVDEGGACHYTNCEGGEMIPASDLPGALLALNDARQEEHEEWRFDWEALRAEAKELEAENQRLQEELTTSYLRREADGLIAENQRLRETLERISVASRERFPITGGWVNEIAREALAGDAE